MQRPLLLLDTASLYYRSFYALPESMTAPDGHPHNAVRGLLTTMARLVREHRPAMTIACWDDDWRPQWRVDALPGYKTHRVAESGELEVEQAPDTLGPQVDAIGEILDVMGVPRLGAAGFEADDVIATLAHHSARPVVAVTGDRDLVQIVRPGVSLLLTVNGGMEKWPLLDPDGVVERFGVAPEQYVDLAVLRGDPSDGILGVPGFGAKTAAAVLGAYGSLDAALAVAHAGTIAKPLTPRLAELLRTNADLIAAMQFVARARIDVPITVPAHLRAYETSPELTQLADEWGVTRFVEDLRSALNDQIPEA